MSQFVSEQFGDHHDASTFDSGVPDLDDWLRKSARDSDGRAITRTYVWHGDGEVVAYYSLMPYLIERGTLSGKQGRGLPDAIPCYLLAKLALSVDLQGRRLGAALLAEALSRAVDAAASVGGRFVVADAIDDQAASFYARMGFGELPGQPDRLVLRVKDIQRLRSSVADEPA